MGGPGSGKRKHPPVKRDPNKLSIGQKSDIAFKKFQQSSWYKTGIEPLKNQIQYPDNYIRRIWDEAFGAGINLVFEPETNLYPIKEKPDKEFK